MCIQDSSWVKVMEVNSANITQVQQSQPQPQQQQVVERRAFEEDLAQQQAQQSVETTPTPDENQNATTDYTSLIREARTVQATSQSVETSTATNEDGQSQDVQHIAVAAYQENRENYEAPTSSGELLPRIDAII